jgi:hypothetical protein
MTIKYKFWLSQKPLGLMVIVIVLVGLIALHPYHVSITEIHQNPESGKLEITIQAIPEDLINVIQEQSVNKLYIGEARESQLADSLLARYLKANFSLQANDKAVDVYYLGKEVFLDAFWCYLESDSLPEMNTLQIKNTILTELNPTQTNIVHVFIGKEKRTAYLSRDTQSKVLNINN